MPGYGFLAEKDLNLNNIAGHLKANRIVGVPYTDEQIAGAARGFGQHFETEDFGTATGAGQDLHASLTITLADAAKGTKTRVHLPTGKDVEVKWFSAGHLGRLARRERLLVQRLGDGEHGRLDLDDAYRGADVHGHLPRGSCEPEPGATARVLPPGRSGEGRPTHVIR